MLSKLFIAVSILACIPGNVIYSQENPSRDVKREIIDEVIEIIGENYVFPDQAEMICDTIRESFSSGRYDNADNYNIFTDILNEDFRRVNDDRHLRSWMTSKKQSKEVDPNVMVANYFGYISEDKSKNFGIPKVEILEGNVGYMEILSFKPCPNRESERIVKCAMDFLSNCDALIIDLRNNRGGHTNMREFVSGYFFRDPVQLSSTFSRETASEYRSYTLKDFYNQRLVDIPLYILTSSRTISCPEIFAYDLQALKRAVVVGEVTAGSVHSGRIFNIKDAIYLLVARGYTQNPVTKTCCEGVGVQPDIMVSADEALVTAHEAARKTAATFRAHKDSIVREKADDFYQQLAAIEKVAEQDIDRAENALKKLIRTFYDDELLNAYLVLELGEWYLNNHQANMAIIMLKQGIVYYHALYEIHAFYRLLAEAYEASGDLLNARICYLDYLKHCPDDAGIFEKLDRLRGN